METITQTRSRRKPTRIQVELINLLGWSGTGGLIGGLLLVLIWAVFDLALVEEASLYIPYAAPLLNDAVIMGMLVIGVLEITNFIICMVTIGMVLGRKQGTVRMLLIISAGLQVWIPVAGTFFGVIMLSEASRWSGALDSQDEPISRQDGALLFIMTAVSFVLTWVSLLLFLPGVYILPVEFLNDADAIWWRYNIWNLIYLVIGIIAAISGFFAATAYMVKQQVKGWKPLLWICCVFMIFAIPVGPYMSGVLYRTFLQKR